MESGGLDSGRFGGGVFREWLRAAVGLQGVHLHSDGGWSTSVLKSNGSPNGISGHLLEHVTRNKRIISPLKNLFIPFSTPKFPALFTNIRPPSAN